MHKYIERTQTRAELDLRARIYVVDHQSMVGHALLEALTASGFTCFVHEHAADLDLLNQAAVDAFFADQKPEYVFLCAAQANEEGHQGRDAECLYKHLSIATHLIHASYRNEVEKLLFIAPTSVYPEHTAQPICGEDLLSSSFEPRYASLGLAHLAGIKLCEQYHRQYGCKFVAAVSVSLYGALDEHSAQQHLLLRLLFKMHEAHQNQLPTVEIHGRGIAKRSFMHVDDLARACLLIMDEYHAWPDQTPFINIGVEEDMSVSALAHLIKRIVGYSGELLFNPTKPEGAPRRLLDFGLLKSLGFKPSISLEGGLRKVYAAYINTLKSA